MSGITSILSVHVILSGAVFGNDSSSQVDSEKIKDSTLTQVVKFKLSRSNGKSHISGNYA